MALPLSPPDPTRTPGLVMSLADTASQQANGLLAAAKAPMDDRWTHSDRFLAVAVLARELASTARHAADVATFLEGVQAARVQADVKPGA